MPHGADTGQPPAQRRFREARIAGDDPHELRDANQQKRAERIQKKSFRAGFRLFFPLFFQSDQNKAGEQNCGSGVFDRTGVVAEEENCA